MGGQVGLLGYSMGSLGFVATARCAWLVTKHPHEADLCAIGRVKGNVGRDPGGLAYRVVDGAGGPTIAWEQGTVDLEMEGFLGGGDGSGGGRGGALEEAKGWLASLLENGPVAAGEVRRLAGERGITEITLQRAKRDLEIPSVRQDGQWLWAIPEGGLDHHHAEEGG